MNVLTVIPAGRFGIGGEFGRRITGTGPGLRVGRGGGGGGPGATWGWV